MSLFVVFQGRRAGRREPAAPDAQRRGSRLQVIAPSHTHENWTPSPINGYT